MEGTDEFVELGGNWIDPLYQPLIAAEIDRYGLELVHGDPGTEQRTVIGGQVLHGMLPVPQTDIIELERAVWECLAASRRIEYGRPWEEQGLEDLDVSWAEYVRGLKLSPAVEEYLMTWTSASDPEQSSALNILVLLATFRHSAWAAYNSMELKFACGTAALVDAIAADVHAEIYLDSVVTCVEQTADEVVVTTVDGRTFTAANAVLATPVNTWADVTFTPRLSEAKQEVARLKHVGTGQKIWMQLTGTPAGGVFGWGFGKGVNWLLRDRQLPAGGDLYVGFTGGGRLNIEDHDSVPERRPGLRARGQGHPGLRARLAGGPVRQGRVGGLPAGALHPPAHRAVATRGPPPLRRGGPLPSVSSYGWKVHSRPPSRWPTGCSETHVTSGPRYSRATGKLNSERFSR